MTPLPTIMPISDLRQNTAAIIQTVQTSREPVVITQRGRAAAVVIDIASFEDLRSRTEIISMIRQSEEEISRGEWFEADEVMDEIDEMLAAKR